MTPELWIALAIALVGVAGGAGGLIVSVSTRDQRRAETRHTVTETFEVLAQTLRRELDAERKARERSDARIRELEIANRRLETALSLLRKHNALLTDQVIQMGGVPVAMPGDRRDDEP